MEPSASFVRTSDGVTIAWSSVGGAGHGSAGRRPTLVHLPGVPFSNLHAEWRIAVMRVDDVPA